VAGAASLVLALGANAATVKLGGDGGELNFFPGSVTIAKGESVTWCAHNLAAARRRRRCHARPRRASPSERRIAAPAPNRRPRMPKQALLGC
jgi:plastocyanin